MIRLLHIDASARSARSDEDRFGSHTRRLSARFVSQWQKLRPSDAIAYRDVGLKPPSPVTGEWIHAAFTKPDERENWMHDVLHESDALVDELIASDIIVAAVPMYNFGPPAQFKAYIDNVVRVGRTFGFDRKHKGEPYWPLLTDRNRTLVVLSSRGDFGYEPGDRISHMNHVEPSIQTAFRYIGITRFESIAIEYDEYADDSLESSIRTAEAATDELVQRLVRETTGRTGLANDNDSRRALTC